MAPAARAFVEAAIGLGYRRNNDFNGGERGGVGGESVTIVDGVRFNTGMVYLTREVRARPNLTILPDTLVDRILFEGRRARAVRLADGREIEAGEIVLSAGTYGSPAILLRSGVGPSAHLQPETWRSWRICRLASDCATTAVRGHVSAEARGRARTADRQRAASGPVRPKPKRAELDQQLVITVQPERRHRGQAG